MPTKMDKELLLYKYFSNLLTQEERLQFDALLDVDAEFKTQFNFEENLQRAIKDKEKQNLKSKLISFETNILVEAPKTSSKKLFRYVAIAASIAMLIGLAWIGYIDGSSSNYEDLYAANFQEYPNTVFAITRGETVESLERDAFVAYESKNYKEAIDYFEKMESPAAYIDFYKAQCYLGLAENIKAIDLFKKVEKEHVDFKAEASWYLALTYLKEKDKLKAIDMLEAHIQNYEFNKENAIVLLAELD